MMQLKKYQFGALNSISRYFSNCLKMDSVSAFKVEQPLFTYKNPSEHPNLRDIPYVCIRIPTGGGKTILAAHSIERVAKAYLNCDFPVTLWLVPSKTIKNQTAEALKNPQHPYRAVLDKVFNRQVIVIKEEEFSQLRPQDWGNKAIVIVSTLQNFRVEEKEGRKIYSFHEQLTPHFERLPKNIQSVLSKISESDLQEHGLQPKQLGKVKCSFANLIKAYRPFVIVDEAHNARTPLTFDVLADLSPSAILEFTATPNTNKHSGSNVLYHVGANVLKQEEMIKLPIILTEHKTWQQAVDGAYLRRGELAKKAQYEPDYVRPIVLFQADSKNGDVPVETLKQYLMDELGINEYEIAVVTGTQRELDKINLLATDCSINYIITVEALKEGWDCPFAYVFCSVQNVTSSKEAEQLLGRVLRMPYAKRRQIEDLNRAYAHLSSKSFGDTARNLQDKLIGMGFEALEVADMLHMQQEQQLELLDENEILLFQEASVCNLPPTILELDKLPNNLTESEQAQLTTTEQDGKFLVKVLGVISDNMKNAILKTATGKKKEHLDQQIAIHQAKLAKLSSPAEKGEVFPSIPKLCVVIQGELEIADPQTLLDYHSWNLLDYPAKLTNFHLHHNNDSFELDIDGDKLTHSFYAQQLYLTDDWLDLSKNDFIRWLDNHVRLTDVSQATMLVFLQRLVDDLLLKPNVSLTNLLRQKFGLVRSIQELINDYRQKAIANCYQASLFNNNDTIQTCLNSQYQFNFDLAHYSPRPPFYSGSYKFKKSYFAHIEDLKSKGEEFECATVIDSLPQVKYWLRNTVKRGFSLPLAKDNFYPDFIAVLQDGRILVIEYKGEPYRTNDDSKEKCLIAEQWARLSDGKCLFIMAVKQDNQGRDLQTQIISAIESD